MKNWIVALSMFVTVICLALCAGMYVDNRNLLHQIAVRNVECVSPRSYESLLSLAERLGDINRRDQVMLHRTQTHLQEVYDAQETANLDRQKRRGHGQVWRSARNHRPKNHGRGGP